MKNAQNLQIELSDVYFRYEDTPALNGISLQIFEGETVGLKGDNGSGKSTLLRLLNGLVYPDSGKYMLDGKEINSDSMRDTLFARALHTKIGYVFQNSDTQLFCGSVREEVEFGPRQMGLSDEEVEKRAGDVIRMLDLEKIENRPPYHLSGGEKKKTALAAVLSMNPDILMLDEPMNGLDKKTVEWLTGFMSLWKEAGKTLIVATHDENLLYGIADKVIELHEGKII
ncbi:MAG: ABC transporter ATP-binding protein [Lachnospiraceae bacterium]|nr:ABC transporter ATP-binding protein [Lachnospiraceae bacterium]